MVTEAAENFWKIGAVTETVSTISDISDETAIISRTQTNTFEYNERGMLASNITNASSYEGDADANKQTKITFTYDDYGNVLSQSVEGTELAERKTTTNYDSEGLFAKATANALGHTTQVSYNSRG